ncbi:MAG: hypothetical protein WC509_06140 [Candidatus Izemoplasmatales bacterium]
MTQWFDTTHIVYIVVSLGLTGLLLFLAKKAFTTERAKNRFLKTFGLLTFFLHTSILWYDFLADGSAAVPDNVLFPIYFCNLSMYMLLLTAFVEKRDTRFYRFVSIMTAYGGFFGAMISLIYPEYYFNQSSIFVWSVFKSMASHSTMLVGALWLFVGGYVPIRRRNVLSYGFGLLVYGAIGLAVNGIFDYFDLGDPNAMYLSRPPLAEAPFLSCYTIAALMVAVVYGVGLLAERSRRMRVVPPSAS